MDMPETTRTAAEVAAMLDDGRDIAFLDVREIVPFGTSHPLLATHLALGHIECEIAGLGRVCKLCSELSLSWDE
jgi:hypothetical protein